MMTFLFGMGLHATPPEAEPAAAPAPAVARPAGALEDPWDPGLGPDEFHRRLMLLYRDGDMLEPDKPVRFSVAIPRRLHGQFTMLARHRGRKLGQLSAEILARYMRRYYRGLAAEPAAADDAA